VSREVGPIPKFSKMGFIQPIKALVYRLATASNTVQDKRVLRRHNLRELADNECTIQSVLETTQWLLTFAAMDLLERIANTNSIPLDQPKSP
jgi:hypothetical protein